MKLSIFCVVGTSTILLLDLAGFVLGKNLKNQCDDIGMEMISKKECKENTDCKVKGRKCKNFSKVCGDITKKKKCKNKECKFDKNKNTCKDKPATYSVQVGADDGGLKFVPDTLIINKEDTVKWINNEDVTHSVAFSIAPDSADLNKISGKNYLENKGDKYVVKFNGSGVYEYICGPHYGSEMKGTITVK
mmetsp:Transcript_22228/g.23771  ORF Transcript_22228/g.23771 Transcript_22228/m.23771 type:complete len:190 (-) Transcript_22228:90-659(-)